MRRFETGVQFEPLLRGQCQCSAFVDDDFPAMLTSVETTQSQAVEVPRDVRPDSGSLLVCEVLTQHGDAFVVTAWREARTESIRVAVHVDPVSMGEIAAIGHLNRMVEVARETRVVVGRDR